MKFVLKGKPTRIYFPREKNLSTGDLDNSLVLTFQLYESDGTTPVDNGSGSIPSLGSGGRYEGFIPAAADVVVGNNYVLIVSEASQNEYREINLLCKAQNETNV